MIRLRERQYYMDTHYKNPSIQPSSLEEREAIELIDHIITTFPPTSIYYTDTLSKSRTNAFLKTLSTSLATTRAEAWIRQFRTSDDLIHTAIYARAEPAGIINGKPKSYNHACFVVRTRSHVYVFNANDEFTRGQPRTYLDGFQDLEGDTVRILNTRVTLQRPFHACTTCLNGASTCFITSYILWCIWIKYKRHGRSNTEFVADIMALATDTVATHHAPPLRATKTTEFTLNVHWLKALLQMYSST